MITERKITIPAKRPHFKKMLFLVPVNNFMVTFPNATPNRRRNDERSVATNAQFAIKS